MRAFIENFIKQYDLENNTLQAYFVTNSLKLFAYKKAVIDFLNDRRNEYPSIGTELQRVKQKKLLTCYTIDGNVEEVEDEIYVFKLDDKLAALAKDKIESFLSNMKSKYGSYEAVQIHNDKNPYKLGSIEISDTDVLSKSLFASARVINYKKLKVPVVFMNNNRDRFYFPKNIMEIILKDMYGESKKEFFIANEKRLKEEFKNMKHAKLTRRGSPVCFHELVIRFKTPQGHMQIHDSFMGLKAKSNTKLINDFISDVLVQYEYFGINYITISQPFNDNSSKSYEELIRTANND